MDTLSTDNVTGMRRGISRILRPKSVQDVVNIVREAQRSGEPLYPVSTGLNWGYGSRSPVLEGCALLDLSAMNRIRNLTDISVRHPVALIEPGVTQGQLHDALAQQAPDLRFNTTGSARATSLLGNALDGGVGYLGPRREDVFGLEVVTGTGELLYTGFRRLGEASPLAQSHPYGLGPLPDGLFFQGRGGIVVSACMKLRPRQPVQIGLTISLRPRASFAALYDALFQLKRDGVLPDVVHIGNRIRSHTTVRGRMQSYLREQCGLSAERAQKEADLSVAQWMKGAWTAVGGLSGSAAHVRDALTEARRRLRPMAHVSPLSGDRLALAYRVSHRLRALPAARRMAAFLSAVKPLHDLAQGSPSDIAVQSLLAHHGKEDAAAATLDRSRCGLIYICPALPPDGAFTASFLRQWRRVAKAHGLLLPITVNIDTPHSAVAIANLSFDRGDPEQVALAHACADQLLSDLHKAGLEVYRARADMMADVVRANDPYWQMMARVQRALDPHGIIAPGRYGLPPA